MPKEGFGETCGAGFPGVGECTAGQATILAQRADDRVLIHELELLLPISLPFEQFTDGAESIRPVADGKLARTARWPRPDDAWTSSAAPATGVSPRCPAAESSARPIGRSSARSDWPCSGYNTQRRYNLCAFGAC